MGRIARAVARTAIPAPAATDPQDPAQAELTYRPPFDWAGLLAWFGARQLPGTESVTASGYRVALALPGGPTIAQLNNDESGHRISATLALSDPRDYDPACAAVRRLLDLDADPAIDEHLSSVPELASLVKAVPGIRIPGTPTPLEAALRALTGQQVSVASGLAQLRRMISHVQGHSPDATDLHHTELRPFPDPAEILEAGFDWYRGPAVRRETLRTVLTLAADGLFEASNDLREVARRFAAVKGVGPWTVAYTMLRGFGDPDADLSADRAVVNAARSLSDRPAADILVDARPWRSYAALHLWQYAAREG